MSEKAFLTWYEILQDKVLSAIDNVIATPVNNLIFFLSMAFKTTTSPDARHPYPSVNNSRNAVEYKELVLAGTIVSLIGSIAISFYKRLRDKESVSNYYFFENIFPYVSKDEADINLRTAAYFYNPDISPIVLALRRAWAYLMGNSDFKNLEKYLAQENKTKEFLLKEINKKLATFISNKKKYGEWSTDDNDENGAIKPPSTYVDDWRKKKEARLKKGESKNSNFSSLGEKKTVFQYILSFINSRLDELGRASFVYWIGVFIFYFFPSIGVVGTVTAIVWPPILIAGVFLGAIWAIKIYTYYQKNKQPKFNNLEKPHKATIEFIEEVKQQIQLELLKQEIGTLSNNKTKVKKPLKGSKLSKDIKWVLREKRSLVGVRAVFNGFIIGCFTIYFSSWLLNSAAFLVLGLFVTISSAALTFLTTVVGLVTLVLGLTYGIYFAVKKYNEEMENFLNMQARFSKLEQKCGDIEIPNVSLRECDLFFRRYTIKPSAWTFIKQFFKRIWVGTIRLGTGILFLKLLPFGLATTLLYAFYGITAIPAFYPILAIMLAGGLFFAAWHIWLYHCASQEDKLVKIMDVFLNPPGDLQSSSSSPSLAEKKEKNDPVESNLIKLSQIVSRFNSESCLNYTNLNDMQTYISTDSSDINTFLKFEDCIIPQKKRSDTFPGTAGDEKKRNLDFIKMSELLNKKNENISEALMGSMNKNGFHKVLIRRISSEPCLDDDKDENIGESFKAIPQRKRSGTFPNANSFVRKRKVGIATNYFETLKPSSSTESLGL